MNIKNIENLIIQSKQGDKKAIEELLLIYEPLINKHSRHYYIRGYDEEDMHQISRLAILRGLSKFNSEHGANFTGYLEVVIRNAFTTILHRKENKIIYPSLESVNEEGVELKEMFQDDFDLESSFIESEDMDKLRQELNKLDPEDKKLLLIAYGDYGSLKEYSKISGEAYHNLRRRRDRLVNKIRQELT